MSDVNVEKDEDELGEKRQRITSSLWLLCFAACASPLARRKDHNIRRENAIFQKLGKTQCGALFNFDGFRASPPTLLFSRRRLEILKHKLLTLTQMCELPILAVRRLLEEPGVEVRQAFCLGFV